jgi:hypothetical protein
MEWMLLACLSVHPLVVLACAALSARRRHKGPPVIVFAVTFGLQFVAATAVAIHWTIHPPVKGFLWKLGYTLLPLEGQLWSAAVLGVVSLVGVTCIHLKAGTAHPRNS